MSDPFMGWLSHVDQLTTVMAHISTSIATISGSAAIVLGSLLSMWTGVRRFRRDLVVVPVGRCKPAAKSVLPRKSQRLDLIDR